MKDGNSSKDNNDPKWEDVLTEMENVVENMVKRGVKSPRISGHVRDGKVSVIGTEKRRVDGCGDVRITSSISRTRTVHRD